MTAQLHADYLDAEEPGPLHRPDCAIHSSHEPCNRNCLVMAAVAVAVAEYEHRCARKGGCKTVGLKLFIPVIEAWQDNPTDLPLDPVMAALWVFIGKLRDHVDAGWEEHGRPSIAAPAFAPVAAAYRVWEAAA